MSPFARSSRIPVQERERDITYQDMGSLYSRMSGGRSGSGGDGGIQVAAASTTAVDPVIIRGKEEQNHDASPLLPDTSINASSVSLGIEVNGESDDSQLVTSSSHAHPAAGHHVPSEDGEEDTDETEAEDVNNASLAVHPSTDDTLNTDPTHVSETNGHTSSSGGSSVIINATPSKAETVATWAQVVAGMSGQCLIPVSLILHDDNIT